MPRGIPKTRTTDEPSQYTRRQQVFDVENLTIAQARTFAKQLGQILDIKLVEPEVVERHMVAGRG